MGDSTIGRKTNLRTSGDALVGLGCRAGLGVVASEVNAPHIRDLILIRISGIGRGEEARHVQGRLTGSCSFGVHTAIGELSGR